MVLFFSIPLYGVDRDRSLGQLYHTGWTYGEGAPGQIHALAQTVDGYLWLGTSTGLFRYDGIQFLLYKPNLGQTFAQRNIASLLATPDGGLWVGYWYGGISFIKNGAVTDYGGRDGVPSSTALAFARDRSGAVWAALGKNGIARFDGSRWEMLNPNSGFSGPANTIFVSRSGTIWVGTPNSVACRPDGELKFRTVARGLLRVKSFAESPDGTLWMAETGYGVRPVPISNSRSTHSPNAILVGSQAIAFDHEGSLWITTLGNGIRRVPYPDRLHSPTRTGPSAWQSDNSGVEAFTPQEGLTSDYINCVLEDREGNVWIGTSGGLDRFRQGSVVSIPLQPVASTNDRPIPSIHSFTTSSLVAGDENALWAAGIGPQMLVKFQHDKIALQLRDKYIDCGYRSPSGVIWFATPWSIYRLSKEQSDGALGNTLPRYDYERPIPAGEGQTLRRLRLPITRGISVGMASRVKAMTQDATGRLWVSMETGIFRLEDAGWTSLVDLGGPQGSASVAFTDSLGRVWFGVGSTVVMLHNDKVQSFSNSQDGGAIGTVTSIQEDQKRVWFGGELGLEYFDGARLQSIHQPDGKPFEGVSGIVTDPDSGVWFSEQDRLIHIRADQLRETSPARAAFESFGSLDGFTAALRGSLATPSATRTTDGRIWLATTKGFAWIDPKRITKNVVPPIVLIESLTADDKTYDSFSKSLQLSPRTKNLQITYTATSLTVPERVRFRYRLEGLDKEWQDAGGRREAFFTNLDPGSYKFRVIACNNDGVWNEIGSTVNFVVLPAFDQTLWFRLVCALALAGILWWLYLLRLKHATAQVREILGARLEERARIARELHDTLLQGFQGLLLRFDAVKKTMPADHPAQDLMNSVLDRADGLLFEGRERVRDLRQDEVSSDELPNMLASRGQELCADSEIRFSLSVLGTPQPLDLTVGKEMCKIGQEALTNAFLHSSCSKIEVEVSYDDDRLLLRVRDDGIGISREVLLRGRDGHWGLLGMRERTQEIGGELKIWSERGMGAEIEVEVPAAIAYHLGRKRTYRRWISRLLRPDKTKSS